MRISLSGGALCYNTHVGSLYLVATPIGNLEDITLRAVRVLGEVSLIAAEDTRRTRKLLTHYTISVPTISYHDHNKDSRRTRLLQALEGGDVAVVSDAGTPGLSDPGYELVQAALEAGHEVIPIPGPSALTAALIASGLPTDSFTFLGYLPRRGAARKQFLGEIQDEKRTMIFFEAPHRLQASLRDLETILGHDRPVAVCRELTKIHEEIQRGCLSEVREHFDSIEPRGEITLVVGGAPEKGAWQEEEVAQALAKSLSDGMSPSQAARKVAAESGWPRRKVYLKTMEGK